VLRNALLLHPGLMRAVAETPLDRAGITLSPEKSWHAQSRTTWMVPGTPLRLSGLMDLRWLCIARSGFGRIGRDARRALAIVSETPVSKLLVNRSERLQVCGRRLELVPRTAMPSQQAALARDELPATCNDSPANPGIPRSTDTIYLTWHIPENRTIDRAQIRTNAPVALVRTESRFRDRKQ